MIPLPTARRRAEAFEAAVSAPGSSRPSDPSLEPLLATVGALRAEARAGASTATPRPDFVAELRERLMTEADTVLVPRAAAETAGDTAADTAADTAEDRLRLRRSPNAPRRQRRVAALATAALIVGGSSTVAYASQDALPGDSLYTVKLALEDARGSITFTDGAKGSVTLNHAEQRLDEVAALVERGNAASTAQVPDGLDAFSEQAAEAAELLLADRSDTQAEIVRSFVADSVATLTTIEPSLNAAARPALGRAVTVLQTIDADALEVCPTCGSSGGIDVPFALSATADEYVAEAADPALPDVDSAALPPGSVAGGAESAPTAEPSAPPPSSPTPTTTPEAGASSAPTTQPSAPATTDGGVSDLTEPVTGATGPLSGPLGGLTEAVDKLLGLG